MKVSFSLAILLGSLGLTSLACAANASEVVQRDVNQQKRIEQGLQSGQLTAQETAKLEHSESQISRVEANALKDGNLSPAEQRRLNRLENQTSAQIYRDKHNGQAANPNSPTERRLAADVQRDVYQQQRIENGIKHDSLTNQETARLERGQARDDRLQARAARKGFVTAADQRRIQTAENRQSHRIWQLKHNPAVAP